MDVLINCPCLKYNIQYNLLLCVPSLLFLLKPVHITMLNSICKADKLILGTT